MRWSPEGIVQISPSKNISNKEKWIPKWCCTKDGIKKSLCRRCGCVVDGAKSTKGNEKITSANPNRQKTTLQVLRFNPLFIQFSFPISLRLSKTFSEIKGYYRFIALCRVFFASGVEKIYRKSILGSDDVMRVKKKQKCKELLKYFKMFSWWTIIKSTLNE